MSTIPNRFARYAALRMLAAVAGEDVLVEAAATLRTSAERWDDLRPGQIMRADDLAAACELDRLREEYHGKSAGHAPVREATR
jgi:hypothetical protein